jgi:hypothetical protein
MCIVKDWVPRHKIDFWMVDGRFMQVHFSFSLYSLGSYSFLSSNHPTSSLFARTHAQHWSDPRPLFLKARGHFLIFRLPISSYFPTLWRRAKFRVPWPISSLNLGTALRHPYAMRSRPRTSNKHWSLWKRGWQRALTLILRYAMLCEFHMSLLIRIHTVENFVLLYLGFLHLRVFMS